MLSFVDSDADIAQTFFFWDVLITIMDGDLKDIGSKIDIWWLHTARLKSNMLSNSIHNNIGLMA